mmetsp:Transcript_13982/g.21160  ORF Transcript_13982/g.21160 Transcript_13982/m.21160 type:complete len:369 (+) Transcript_13982:37-1143(+)
MGKKKANAQRKMKQKTHQKKYKDHVQLGKLSKRNHKNPLASGLSKTAIISQSSIVDQLIERMKEAKAEKKPYRIDHTIQGCVPEEETFVNYEIEPQQYLEDEDDDTYIEDDQMVDDEVEEPRVSQNDHMTDAERDEVLIHKYSELLGDDEEAEDMIQELLTDAPQEQIVKKPPQKEKKKEVKKKKNTKKPTKIQPHSPLYFIGTMAHQSHQVLELLAAFQKKINISKFRVLSKAIHHVAHPTKKHPYNMYIPLQSVMESLKELNDELESFKNEQKKRVKALKLNLFDEKTLPIDMVHALHIKPMTKANQKGIEKILKGFGTIIRLYASTKKNEGVVEFADSVSVMNALNQAKRLQVNNQPFTVFVTKK